MFGNGPHRLVEVRVGMSGNHDTLAACGLVSGSSAAVADLGMLRAGPLIIQAEGTLPTLHALPDDAVLEVPISHPEFGWFAGLGLRWYAVPVISDMYLDIGGVCYPAAPFNGWYMCTEIGSRDLGDASRYDQLPVVARRMGLSTASHRTLWKDRAMTELNLAVLHSFDHHTESARFLQHIDREERHGRACPADWTWIVPPATSSATPVFHRYYRNFDQTPNFYRHAALPRTQAARAPRPADIPQLPHGSQPGSGRTGPGTGTDLPGIHRGSRPYRRRRTLAQALRRACDGRHA